MSADEIDEISIIAGEQTGIAKASIEFALGEFCEVGGGIAEFLFFS